MLAKIDATEFEISNTFGPEECRGENALAIEKLLMDEGFLIGEISSGRLREIFAASTEHGLELVRISGFEFDMFLDNLMADPQWFKDERGSGPFCLWKCNRDHIFFHRKDA